jgi:membrane protein implicated in regulation of membrane protease activity
MHEPRDGEGVPTRSGGLTAQSLSLKNRITSFANPITLIAGLLLVIALYVIAATVIGSFVIMLMTGLGYPDALRPTARVVVLGFASIAFTAPAIVLWLRWLERRDSSHDEPPVDRQLLREMARREDWIAQNHMGSVVLVKPGVLRTALFRAGHLGLGLVLRAIATNGYLGSMRTVHFAHWAFVNNGSRLMFFSNFDHSWESYLDDFIEKAHGGLTLAWGSGVGFPPTRFLVLDGASHGRKFKAWARHSMAVSRFWFSAYRDLTVDQIERNARIADGLRKARLTPQEAEAWVRDL